MNQYPFYFNNNHHQPGFIDWSTSPEKMKLSQYQIEKNFLNFFVSRQGNTGIVIGF